MYSTSSPFGEAANHADRIAQRCECGRLAVGDAHGRVAAADPTDRAVSEHLVQRGEQRRGHGPVARGRVGDHRADDDLVGRRQHLAVDDERLLPQQVRVERPRVREAEQLRLLRQLDDPPGRRIGLQHDPELHVASPNESAGSRGRRSTSRVGPAGRDDLGARVEVDACGTVDRGVAEQRRLPPAEAVVRHRHRNGHVHADHPADHVELEAPGRATVAGEDRTAVAVRVLVDHRQRVVVRVGAHDRQARVRRSRRRRPSCPRCTSSTSDAPRKKPSPPNSRVAAVDDDPAALGLRGVEVRGHLVAVLAGDERPHLRLRIAARADLQRGQALRDRVDERIGRVTDGHDDRHGHAPLTRRAVGS